MQQFPPLHKTNQKAYVTSATLIHKKGFEGLSTTPIKGLRSDVKLLKLATGFLARLPASVLSEPFFQGIVSLECEVANVIPVHRSCLAPNTENYWLFRCSYCIA